LEGRFSTFDASCIPGGGGGGGGSGGYTINKVKLVFQGKTAFVYGLYNLSDNRCYSASTNFRNFP